MMVTYHFLFTLWFLGMADVAVLTGFWRVFAYATASLFIAIAGLSLTLAAAARRRRGATEGRSRSPRRDAVSSSSGGGS